MNYYERHIGDWIGDTVNLTMLEDGAYNRLIDQYYRSERPLPLDSKELFRLARASSSAERKAVLYVVSTFFVRTDLGFTQKRAQAVIEQFWERDQAAEGKRENDRERQQRARERRKQLFEQLRSHGVVPEFNTPTKQLALELSRVTGSDTPRDDHAPVTRDNTFTQSPITNPQTPVLKPTDPVIVGGQPARGADDDFTPKDAADWLRHFKAKHGFEADPTNVNDRKKLWPVFTGWTNAGLTAGFVDKAVQSAIDGASGPISCLPLYVDRVIATMTSQKPTATDARSESRRRAYEVLTGKTGPQPESQPAEVINGHIKLLD